MSNRTPQPGSTRTFGLGVREHGRRVRERRLHAAARANGPRRCTNIPTDGDIAAHGERAHGVLAVKHDDEVGDVSAYLETPANAARRDAGRRRP